MEISALGKNGTCWSGCSGQTGCLEDTLTLPGHGIGVICRQDRYFSCIVLTKYEYNVNFLKKVTLNAAMIG
jgi:hypothetical protein